MKNPVVLAIIEFLTLGLGTVLLGGKRRSWGVVMMIGAGMLRYEELRIAPLASGVWNPHWLPMIIGLTLMGLVMAREVYSAAKAA
jgi:uncharacterized protein (DUF2062 family)